MSLPKKSEGLFSRVWGTFFYIGFFPWFPGTVASFLAAVIIKFAYPFEPSLLLELPILLVVFFSGVYVSNNIEKTSGEEDPKYVVIDEIAGMMLTVFMLPKSFSVVFGGFVLFRIFDIWKPWLIFRIQRLPNGWGVMMDDLLAGLAALILNAAYFYLVP